MPPTTPFVVPSHPLPHLTTFFHKSLTTTFPSLLAADLTVDPKFHFPTTIKVSLSLIDDLLGRIIFPSRRRRFRAPKRILAISRSVTPFLKSWFATHVAAKWIFCKESN